MTPTQKTVLVAKLLKAPELDTLGLLALIPGLPVQSDVSLMSMALERQAVNVAIALIDKTPMTFANSMILYRAVEMENIELVRAFFPHSHPKDCSSRPLVTAAFKNNIELVRLLLPVSNPHHQLCGALRWAVIHNNADMIELLYDCSKPRVVQQSLRASELSNYFKAKLLSDELKQSIGPSSERTSRTSKKM